MIILLWAKHKPRCKPWLGIFWQKLFYFRLINVLNRQANKYTETEYTSKRRGRLISVRAVPQCIVIVYTTVYTKLNAGDTGQYIIYHLSRAQRILTPFCMQMQLICVSR